MITKKDFSFFKRYLKENGAYNIFKKDYVVSFNCSPGVRKLKDYLTDERADVREILMFCLHWNCTSMGSDFWAAKYNDFKKYHKKHSYGL